jgi:hypothetical protein
MAVLTDMRGGGAKVNDSIKTWSSFIIIVP